MQQRIVLVQKILGLADSETCSGALSLLKWDFLCFGYLGVVNLLATLTMPADIMEWAQVFSFATLALVNAAKLVEIIAAAMRKKKTDATSTEPHDKLD